jgi:hypothetical protein
MKKRYHSIGQYANSRSLHYATPDFPLRLVALASFMRLSEKGAYVDVSTAT